MPRKTSQSKTRKVQVNQTGQTARLQVNTPISTAGAGRGNAQQIADLLTIAQAGVTANEVRQGRKGAVDFQAGTVDEENTNNSYRTSVNRLRARANWIEDEAEYDASLKDLDLANISQEELDDHLNAMFADKYEGIDDPATIETIIPEMQAYRERTYKEVLERQKEAEIEQNGANITIIAEDAYEDAIADPDDEIEFDYLGLDEQIGAVFQGADRNEAHFKTIKDLAIRNGDPDLLRNLPDKWANGQRTYKHIPAYNDRMLAAEAQALAAQAAKEKAAAKVADDAQEDMLNSVALKAVEAAQEGDTGTAFALMEVYSGLPGAEAKEMAGFLTKITTLDNNQDKGDINEPGLAALSSRVYSGQSSVEEIMQNWADGVFGGGKQSIDEVQQLLQTNRTIKSTGGPVTSSKAYGTYLKGIEESYKPDTIIGTFDQTLNEVRIAAREDYLNFVLKGDSPADAAQKVYEKYDPRAERRLVNASQSGAYSPTEALHTFAAGGTISPTRVIQAGVTVDQILTAVDANGLTESRANLLFDEIDRALNPQ